MSAVTNSAMPAAIRADEYPWIDRTVYMNAASAGPVPERARAAVEAFNRRRHEMDRFDVEMIGAAFEDARSAIAGLIGAAPDEIALGPNTSWGVGLAAGFVARGDAPARGRRVVLSDREFPANVYPWLALEHDGVVVERVPTDEYGRPREDALLERLDADDVAAFSVSAVQFSTGYRADLARFGRICRERGILFVVDAIQAVGAVPVDVREAGIDVLAGGGQKWLCGPFGCGYAYIRRELHDALEPRTPGWLGFASSADFGDLLEYRYEFLSDGRKFDQGGTLPSQDYVGLAASVGMLASVGIDRVWRHIRAVQAPLLDWAARRDDVRVVSDTREGRRSGILCVRPRNVAAAFEALRAAGVVCVVREGSIRFSPHFYNTVEEMENIVDVLDGVVAA